MSKVKLSNRTMQPLGLIAAVGMIVIEPGQSETHDLTADEQAQAKRIGLIGGSDADALAGRSPNLPAAGQVDEHYAEPGDDGVKMQRGFAEADEQGNDLLTDAAKAPIGDAERVTTGGNNAIGTEKAAEKEEAGAGSAS